MINLLFISSSPRAELLRVHFQQILKIRIEVVEDFDRGLKDVFEKRPVVVCIQDQIAGVTGESVARHIQLLLGNSAPGFILMYEAGTKVKAVPGLFNHLIDLSAPFEVVCQTLHLALQAQLGDHWDKIYTPPQKEAEAEVGITESLADQLVDEFISENSIFHPHHAPPLSGLESTSVDNPFTQELLGGPPAELQSARPEPAFTPDPVDAVIASVSPKSLPIPKDVPSVSRKQTVAPEPERTVRQVQQAPIVAEKAVVLDEASVPVDELLQAFEENYRSSKRLKLRVVLAVVALSVILLLVWAAQQGRFKKTSVVPVKQQVAAPLQKASDLPVASSVTLPVPPVQAVATKPDPFPSFIPRTGHDPVFSSKKPGWSRYLTEMRDYRLFQAEGRLRAVQVLAVGNGSIAPAELKLSLRELTGNEQYRTDSHESKGHLRLERATVPGRAELLIYRSSVKGPIKAFVIQLTP